MPAPKQVFRQRDFSGGEVVEWAKRRDDEAIVRASGRDLQNCRILSTGSVENRSGRRALFRSEGRVDEVRMSPTATYRLCFGEGTLVIRSSAGAVVAQAWGYDWTAATAKTVVWDRFDNDIIICFDGQVPKIARWDGGTEWTFLDFEFEVEGGDKRIPFYRIAPKGISLTPSGSSGSVTITFDGDYLVSGMIGNVIRFNGTQMTITAVSTPRSGTALINGSLASNRQTLTFSAFTTTPVVGQLLAQSQSFGATAYGTVVSVASPACVVELTSAVRFVAGGSPVRVYGSGAYIGTTTTVADTSLAASVVWDEEVMNDYRGWPRSVTVDQNRLIFADLPAVPAGISWSYVGLATDHFVGVDATDAFFELAPKRSRVYHVMPGADEFVFTDQGVYYIPISESNPLRPGSVSFRLTPSPPASAVRPISTAQGLLYVGESLDAVVAIVGTGQTAQPYLARPASDLHEHLFEDVVCLAIENAPDARVFALNADGSMAVGRYQPGKEWVGWVPWDGEGDVVWISALGASVIAGCDRGTFTLVEQLDDDVYLDAHVLVNDIPTALSASAGSALLMPDDQGTDGGNLTAAGGIAAVRNGTTAQSAATAASKTSTTDSFWFVKFGQPMRIAKAEVWPSNDSGFASVTPVTVSLRGVTGTTDPTLGSEGSELATTGSIADTTSMQTLTSSDTTTEFTYAIIRIQSASGTHFLGEVRLYSPGASAQTGSLWFLEDKTVDVMDGLFSYGTRVINDGEIVLQEGDDFSGDDVVVGFKWEAIVEPFIPHLPPGQSSKQTLLVRQISELAVAVQNSNGYAVEKWNENSLNWDQLREESAYRTGESQDTAPTLREDAKRFTGVVSAVDPRVRVRKTTAGPLRVLEISGEVTA